MINLFTRLSARVIYDMDSPTCPIGAPTCDYSHHRRPPKKFVAPVIPPPTTSRSTRRQGIVFPTTAVPQEIKNLKAPPPNSKLPPALSPHHQNLDAAIALSLTSTILSNN
ncbi:hypothetical protein PSTT_03446 [Puccinia striiformis]|uniref:Uncharacterized protein n=2 Tax=Puccinia striiformis TaxID=27350 RepID=A0A2S4VWB3_9BASI|nr:hypothetical protein PSTT_03446 [Puccinia striiformis]